MEFMIQPIEASGELLGIFDNLFCPKNAYQCGCNTVQGCSCPRAIMEP